VADSPTAGLVAVMEVVNWAAAVAVLANKLSMESAIKVINVRSESFLLVFMLLCLRVQSYCMLCVHVSC
jgi:hypothetical protein